MVSTVLELKLRVIQSVSFWIFRECFHVEYKEAFSLFDDQGDGKIESDQIGRLLRSLNLNPDDEDIEKIEKSVGEL